MSERVQAGGHLLDLPALSVVEGALVDLERQRGVVHAGLVRARLEQD